MTHVKVTNEQKVGPFYWEVRQPNYTAKRQKTAISILSSVYRKVALWPHSIPVRAAGSH